MKTVYINDDGTLLILDTLVNITSASIQNLKIQKPDDSTFDLVASIYDKTKLRGVMVPGDFDQEGIYKAQAYVELPSWKGRGDTVEFEVKPLFT